MVDWALKSNNHHHHLAAGKLIPRLFAEGDDGELLPSAREVSTRCFPSLLNEKRSELDPKFNQNLMQFGQFFSHDLGLTPIAKGQAAAICVIILFFKEFSV